jgi:hypothetical protein
LLLLLLAPRNFLSLCKNNNFKTLKDDADHDDEGDALCCE